MSFYVKNDGVQGPDSLVISYNSGSGFTDILTISNPANTFTLHTIDFTGLTNTSGNTTFRFTATGANNNNQGAGLDYDDIKFTGCRITAPAPTITKSFSPDPIVKGATSTLTFNLSNTAFGNQALTGVAFSDVLPEGLSVADDTSSQCGGTLTTVASTRTIELTGGSLAADGSCPFGVTVTGATEGEYDNVTGYISSTESGTSTNYATDSLTVIAPPTISKSFSPTSLLTGEDSTLTFDITNPNQLTALTGIGFTDTLPSGLTIADSGPTAKCGGSLTTTSPSLISFTGGSLAQNTTCTFNVTVTGATTGSKANTTSAVTSTQGGNGDAASATLLVSDPVALISLNKQISTDNLNWYKFVGATVGGNVYYRFTVSNDGETALNSVTVTDPDPDVTVCDLDGSLAIGGSTFCTVGPVTSVSGLNDNTATADSTETPSTTSTAEYGTTGLTIVKNVTETHFTAAGDVLHYSYVVTNDGFASLLGPVTVADDKSTDETCPAVSTVGDLDNYLDPGESVTCTATYTVQAADVTAGSVTNTASATAGGVTSDTDSETVTTPVADLSITKTDGSNTAAPGQGITYTIVVTNNGPSNVSGATVVDTFPGVLTGVNYTSVTTGTVSGNTASGSGNISDTVNMTNGSTITYTVTGTVSASATGTLANTATVTVPAGTTDPTPGNNTATDTDTLAVSADLSITKESSPNPYVAGDAFTYTIVATNAGPSDATNARVQDALPTALSGFAWTCTPNGSGASCGTASGTGDIDALVTLPSGTSATFAVTGTLPSGTTGELVNTATVAAPAGTTDPVPGNNSGSDTNPTGDPIPTMNEWGMIIFAILLGFGSIYYMRRQRRVEESFGS